jgi:hypothetical protein
MGMRTGTGLPLTVAQREANSDRRKPVASGVVRTMRVCLGAALVAIAASSGSAAGADRSLACER